MTNNTASISQSQLCGYIDGRLDPLSRMAVEAFLADNPAVAAAVMEDLRNKHAVQLRLQDEYQLRSPPALLANRIGRLQAGSSLARAAPRAIVLALALMGLWLAQDEFREDVEPGATPARIALADAPVPMHGTVHLR